MCPSQENILHRSKEATGKHPPWFLSAEAKDVMLSSIRFCIETKRPLIIDVGMCKKRTPHWRCSVKKPQTLPLTWAAGKLSPSGAKPQSVPVASGLGKDVVLTMAHVPAKVELG